MARWHLSSWRMLIRTVARGLAWVTDIAAIVVLCFVAQRWTTTCGAVTPGIIGAVIALLNDSWQMVAFTDRSLGLEPMKPHRTLMHDIFSLAITLGGIVLMVVSNVQGKDADESVDYKGEESDEIKLNKSTMAWLGLWLLVVVT
ncbi:hypothetical protein ED733_004397 [Metarhizium rileyi]|nr:hypothetical protein ED733_004397 [Metarhizium rileyi]